MSFLLAAGNVFLRDLTNVFPIVVNLWFFATPVFWHPGMFASDPERVKTLMPIIELNPMYHIVAAHRAVLGTSPNPEIGVLSQLADATIPAVITFVVGFCFFRSLQHRFADEV
jgi:lipopolysaccharide transport system permease protein